MKWQNLQQELIEYIRNTVGLSKMSSGSITVDFRQSGLVSVEIGGYDIGDWPRHTIIGPFKSEDEAYEATVAKVAEAKVLLDEEHNEKDWP